MRRDLVATPQAKREAAARVDPDIAALRTRTPAQIDAWVDANVNSLADVRRALKLLYRLALLDR